MHIAIDIPDDIVNILGAQKGGASRAVLEVVAIEAYPSGAITTAQAHRMLGLDSIWKAEELLPRNTMDSSPQCRPTEMTFLVGKSP